MGGSQSCLNSHSLGETSMMSINLDCETEKYLVAILAKENTTSSELIERLLREYLESIQPKKGFFERLLSS